MAKYHVITLQEKPVTLVAIFKEALCSSFALVALTTQELYEGRFQALLLKLTNPSEFISQDIVQHDSVSLEMQSSTLIGLKDKLEQLLSLYFTKLKPFSVAENEQLIKLLDSIPLDFELCASTKAKTVLSFLAKTQILFSYTSLAEAALALDKAQARKQARAIGTCLRTNPLLLVVPCHRVLAADGSLNGYVLGEELKRRFLVREGFIAN